ncbi:hypothetical protein GE09DRAFT_569656 [Coniochaeta sp. 2T2.1]|nr:hypothetical protein GE09DRAFT_569656 [Coniochaeta sp. 2T2.1]
MSVEHLARVESPVATLVAPMWYDRVALSTNVPTLQGDCRSGPQCPDAHVLPDGRRISYGKNGMTINGVPFPYARPITRHNQASTTTTWPSKPSKAPVPATPPSSASPSDDDETIEDFTTCVPNYKHVGACLYTTFLRGPRALHTFSSESLPTNNKDQASQCLWRILLRVVPAVPIVVVVVPPRLSDGRAVDAVHARGGRRHRDHRRGSGEAVLTFCMLPLDDRAALSHYGIKDNDTLLLCRE